MLLTLRPQFSRDIHELRVRDAVLQDEAYLVHGRLHQQTSPVVRKAKKHLPPNYGLTPREDEILFWIACGKTNAEIAKILEIRPATVSKHLEHIYPKLGVENRTAAASFASDEVADEN